MLVVSLEMLIIKALHIIEASRLASSIYIDWAIQEFPHPKWWVVRDVFIERLATLRTLISELEFPTSLAYVNKTIGLLNNSACYSMESKGEVTSKLKELNEWIDTETDQVYVHVRKDKRDFLQKRGSALFAPKTIKSFPSAEEDVVSAANAMVFELYTGAVFHLMRVLEKGLVALARKTPSLENVSFDYENWGNIIDRIESAINKIPDLQDLPKGKERSDRITFFSEAARHFYYLTNAWRNHTMHSRANYDEKKSKEIWDHVKEFMAHLADNGIEEVL